MPSPATRERNSGRSVRVHRKPAGATKGDEPKLMDVLEWRDDGEAYTRADAILDAIRRNTPIETALQANGIGKTTYYRWLREGADIAAERAAMQAGTVPYRRPSKRQEALWWFWQQVQQAEAQAEQELVGAMHDRATGALQAAVVTRELEPKLDEHGRPMLDEHGRPAMVEVKRSEKRNRVLPDTAALQFLLKTRHGERWRGTDTLEVVGSGGGPVEHRHVHTVEGMESLLDKVAERLNAKPIDATAVEIPPLGEGDTEP
jgi:hypothetical protein